MKVIERRMQWKLAHVYVTYICKNISNRNPEIKHNQLLISSFHVFEIKDMVEIHVSFKYDLVVGTDNHSKTCWMILAKIYWKYFLRSANFRLSKLRSIWTVRGTRRDSKGAVVNKNYCKKSDHQMVNRPCKTLPKAYTKFVIVK